MKKAIGDPIGQFINHILFERPKNKEKNTKEFQFMNGNASQKWLLL